MYAASVVTSFPRMKLLTKLVMSDSSEASHEVLIPPPGRGTPTPNELNHVKSGCSVRKRTHQNIHLEKPPPSTKVIPPPSLRKPIPPSTRQTTAAAGASISSTLMMSFKSWGVGIVSSNPFTLFRQAAGALSSSTPTACRVSRTRLRFWLSNTSCAVGDPKLNQAGHAGHGQERPCREQPSSKSPACKPGHDGSYHSAACPD